MSARQLNRLARVKGGKRLDHLLGGAHNEDDEEESEEESHEESANDRTGPGLAAAFGDESSEESSSEDDGSDDDVNGDDGQGFVERTERVEQKDHCGNNDHENAADVSNGDEDATRFADLVKSVERRTSQATPSGASEAQQPIAESRRLTFSAEESGAGDVSGSSAATIPTAKAGVANKNAPVASTLRAPDKKQQEYKDDHEYLDSVIAELRETSGVGGGSSSQGKHGALLGAASPLAGLLRCDPRCLKLDNELRRKFGSSVGPAGRDGEDNGGAGAAPGGKVRRRRGLMPRGASTAAGASLALKRLVVSTPKDDWPKPPSFVGGGLGMARCEGAPGYLPTWQLEAHQGADWFVFERSEALQQLQRRFETIQGMHDPNLLAAFTSQVPYHADALLQLAMVFAHTGQMDRASEFVGRCLYVLESACMDGFRPADGSCRLDSSLEVNKTYFAAMFRHMQMSGMMGGARTALEVGRLLLSLDPLGDPMGCLVALDNHALASREGQFLIELHKSRLAIGYSSSALALAARTREIGNAGFNRPPNVTVEDLPGLSFSVALATLDISGDVSPARDAMSSALLRFPVLLEPLLEKCGLSPRTSSYPQNWKSVMQHPHFGQAKDRLPRGHVLLHLARIFAERGGEIWKHERAQELLYDGAGIALQGLAIAQSTEGSPAGMSAAQPLAQSQTRSGRRETANRDSRLSTAECEVLERAYGPGSPLHKYLDLAISDFVDEGFARLPLDANILDPRLMGPNFMNERIRFRLPPGIGGGEGGGGGRGQEDELLAMAFARGFDDARADVARAMRRGGGNRWRGARSTEGNLNPEAPLMQLLWQSLLPWNVFPTPSRPVPPPPAWL